MTFPEIETAASATQPVSPGSQTRLKPPVRRAGDRTAPPPPSGPRPSRRTGGCSSWAPDAEAENRLAKALWELGELGAAREHYQTALALDPTNRIAERNIDRLRVLLVDGRREDRPREDGLEGAGQHLRRGDRQDGLRAPHRTCPIARSSPRSTRATPSSSCPRAIALIAISNGVRIGIVEPRVAARLLKLMADGNKYLAGVTSLARRTSGSSSARSTRTRATTARSRSRPPPSRPTSGRTRRARSCREDEDLEEDLEDDVEDEEIDGPRSRPAARGHDGRGVRRGDRRARRELSRRAGAAPLVAAGPVS